MLSCEKREHRGSIDPKTFWTMKEVAVVQEYEEVMGCITHDWTQHTVSSFGEKEAEWSLLLRSFSALEFMIL